MIPRADSNSPFARCKQETELKLIAPFGVMCVLLARSYWPISEVAAGLIDVSSLVHSGLDLFKLSSSHFDPEQSWTLRSAPACFSSGLSSG
jgi:hypothetical protein